MFISALVQAQDFIVDAPISTTQVTATKVAATNVSVTGNVTANAFIGNGAGLTNLPAKSWYEIVGIPAQVQRVSNSDYLALSGLGVAGTITATTVSATHLNALNVSGTNIAGRIATTSQNSIQTMTGLSTVSVTGNISVSTINGQVPTFGGSVSWYTIPDIPLQVQRISSSGNITVANISVTANVSVTGNVSANKFIGDGSLLTGISSGGGAVPLFKAYMVSSTQAVSHNTTTKVQFGQESHDNCSCYDTANARFTPNQAGYYQVNYSVRFNGFDANAWVTLYLYKNGSAISPIDENTMGEYAQGYDDGEDVTFNASGLVYLNGSSDYIEVYVNQQSGLTRYLRQSGYPGQGFSAVKVSN